MRLNGMQWNGTKSINRSVFGWDHCDFDTAVMMLYKRIDPICDECNAMQYNTAAWNARSAVTRGSNPAIAWRHSGTASK